VLGGILIPLVLFWLSFSVLEDDHCERWQKYSCKYGIPLEQLTEIFRAHGYHLVPFTDSDEDLDAYMRIRNNECYDPKYIELYAGGKPDEKDYCRKRCKFRVQGIESLRSLSLFIVLDSGELIGWISVGPLDGKETKKAEIAHMIWQRYSGYKMECHKHHLSTETLGKTISIVEQLKARGIFHAEFLHATVHPKNIKPIKILEKNGFFSNGEISETQWGPRKTYSRPLRERLLQVSSDSLKPQPSVPQRCPCAND
jgi:RimJ/RimL family protein N-acetyltransferase